MASAKEIQDRMRSIKDTLKITNAMYMISSSKLKKSKKMLADTEPYFYTLQSEMSRILRQMQRFRKEKEKPAISSLQQIRDWLVLIIIIF